MKTRSISHPSIQASRKETSKESRICCRPTYLILSLPFVARWQSRNLSILWDVVSLLTSAIITLTTTTLIHKSFCVVAVIHKYLSRPVTIFVVIMPNVRLLVYYLGTCRVISFGLLHRIGFNTWMILTLRSLIIRRIILFRALAALDPLPLDARCPFDIRYGDLLPLNFRIVICVHWRSHDWCLQNINLCFVLRDLAPFIVPSGLTARPGEPPLGFRIVFEGFTCSMAVFIMVSPEFGAVVYFFSP